MEEPAAATSTASSATTGAGMLNINLGILGHVDSGKTSLGASPLLKMDSFLGGCPATR
jgi:hypothetical protein